MPSHFSRKFRKCRTRLPVKIAPGDEVAGIDIFLTLVHTVHVRGRVLSAVKGGVIASPSVTLRMNDSDNTASVSAPISVTARQGSELRDRGRDRRALFIDGHGQLRMASGADGPHCRLISAMPTLQTRMWWSARESLWTGKVHMDDDDNALPKGLMISLQPRRSTASPSRAKVSENGEFSVPIVPDETYDLYVLNGPENSYLKSVRIANSERLGQGLEASPGDPRPRSTCGSALRVGRWWEER